MEFKYIKYSQKFYNKLNRLCDPLFKTFGLNHFFYQCLEEDGRLSGMGTFVDWLNYYFENDFHKDNPLFDQYSALDTGCFLPNTIKNKVFQNSLLDSESTFQMSCAMIILKKENNRIHQYGFNCPVNKYGKVINLLISEFSVFKKFINFFDEGSLKLRQEIYQDPQNFKSPCMQSSNPPFPNVNLERREKINFFKNIDFFSFEDQVPCFSQREKDCIKLCLQGQTARQMAMTLSLSPRTIESYINNLKIKLNCYSKFDLITKLQKVQNLEINF